MTKKIFAVIFAFVLIILTSTVFAAGELQDSMNKAGANVKNAVEGTENVLKDGAAAVGNGTKDLGNTIQNGATAVGNGAKNVGTTMQNGVSSVTRNKDENTGYTAMRTATGGTFMGMNGTTWTWFILAIAALAIIGLVWYYAMQNNNDYNKESDNH